MMDVKDVQCSSHTSLARAMVKTLYDKRTNKIQNVCKRDKSKMVEGLVYKLARFVNPTATNSHRTQKEQIVYAAQLKELICGLEASQKDERFNRKVGCEADMDRFKHWLVDNGTECDLVDIRQSKDERFGVFSMNAAIAEGEKVISVPLRVIMTSEPSTDTLARLSHDPLLQSDDSCLLSMRILDEFNNPQSFWKPYLDILPTAFDGLPILCSDLQQFADTSIMDLAVDSLTILARHYVHLFIMLSRMNVDTSRFTWASFLWARCIAMTRQNQIQIVTKSGEPRMALCLIPLYDMFNHKAGPITTCFDPKLNRLETLAPRAISPYQQIYIAYGNRSNQHLMCFSGFVDVTNTDNDRIRLWIALPDDKVKHNRCKLLDSLRIPSQGYFELGPPPVSATSEKLIVFLRVMLMDQNELDTLLAIRDERHLHETLLKPHGISKDCDERVWGWIKLRCIILKSKLAARDSRLKSSELTATNLADSSNAVKIRFVEYSLLSLIERQDSIIN